MAPHPAGGSMSHGPAAGGGEPGGWKVPAGYVFAVLGGIIGLALGSHLWRTEVKLPDGSKAPRYDASARKHGKIILAVAAVMSVFWVAMSQG